MTGAGELPTAISVSDGEALCAAAAPLVSQMVSKLWDHPVVDKWAVDSGRSPESWAMCSCDQLVAAGYMCSDTVSIDGYLSSHCPVTCETQPLSLAGFTAMVDRSSCYAPTSIEGCLTSSVDCVWYYHGTPGSGSCLPMAY